MIENVSYDKWLTMTIKEREVWDKLIKDDCREIHISVVEDNDQPPRIRTTESVSS